MDLDEKNQAHLGNWYLWLCETSVLYWSKSSLEIRFDCFDF